MRHPAMVDAAWIHREPERLIICNGAVEVVDRDDDMIESESHVLHSGWRG
jgi:hypothetical protein